MYEILIIAYIVVSIVLIGFILLQQGKGADMGASFGSGASGTIFGAAGSANFLSRTTAIFAILFFVIALVIGNINTHRQAPQGTFDDLSNEAQSLQQNTTAPALDVPSTKPNSDIPQ
ncbi:MULTISPECIES: preprotein translocase subunit SecG [Testudinibacter]|uniref:Protein-export membrane protein SecG n=1 Tax=Testudinibacter aquarius TaxID=1524974 RepID=A0A4R3YCX2_9PAST|nr:MULTISPECIES: preprotein translocase subunit SecG [Testudinibacter]TNG91867.1 preprotein translocase subunit SecG [Pasteurellaceae bacterium USgator41]TNG94151.1 preprotein translocase subunit SecG [Pasteurellaceae bacterium UScroc12]TNG99693.1 preprotein translocase subunit SecG [Pasteurellaceae bacterium UScroc31]TNH01297.1 preprotein translocase subunit SecG [Pasteurellaceae bacterium USgator11]TNH04844.1 preprotein translocase subunit SecG [Pasteurellaceae bacterium Phil11]